MLFIKNIIRINKVQFQKILVPISRPELTEEIIRIACNLAKVYRSKIYALCVIELPLTLPLDGSMPEEVEKAEKLLQQAQDIAEEDYDMEIETDILQARAAGPAILEEAIELGVDLILLEMSNKIEEAPEEGRIFPSTVEYILQHAKCNVLVIKPQQNP